MTDNKDSWSDDWSSLTDEDFEDFNVESNEETNEATKESADALTQDDGFINFEGLDDINNVDEEVDEIESIDIDSIGVGDESDSYDEDDDYPEEHKKGSLATVLIIVMVVLIVGAIGYIVFSLVTGKNGESTTPTAPDSVTWEEDIDGKVSTLVKSYYEARILQDTYTLSTILDESIVIDEAALANEANVVERYQDIVCYTTEGMNDGEWAIYIRYDVKFKNITTPAPGLVFGYVHTDDSGMLRFIPYEYVSKNEDINNYFLQVSDSDTIRQLAKDVEEKYKAAQAADADLKAYIDSVDGNKNDPTEEEQPTEATQATSATSATSATESTTAAPTNSTTAGSSDFTDCDDMMYITKDGVNVRKSPSTDAEVVTTVKKGDYIHIIKKSSEWYMVNLNNGKQGYISSQFFQSEKPQ